MLEYLAPFTQPTKANPEASRAPGLTAEELHAVNEVAFEDRETCEALEVWARMYAEHGENERADAELISRLKYLYSKNHRIAVENAADEAGA
jgi:hypothetical protein